MCEVSRDEFDNAFEYIAEDIRKATFIAFDTEFTGLTLNESLKSSLFDTGEVRYQKLRQAVKSYIPSQIGISAFIKVEDLNIYDVRTYNFYLYPVSFGPIDVRFLCQASSLQFLGRHNFDFNKFIYEGVPFLNKSQETTLKKYLKSPSSGMDRDVDEEALRECCTEVMQWLLSASEGDKMDVAAPPGVSEYIMLTELKLAFNDMWPSVIDGKIVIERVSEETRKQLEKSSTQEETEENRVLTSMLGFTRIFRLMAQFKKPMIGHNCFCDLLIMYEKFHKPLPSSFTRFKKEITSLFPNIYDTKHIVNTIRKKFDDSLEKSGLVELTRLSSLFEALQSEKGRFYKLYQPGVRHDVGFDRYRDEHCPHEAGYDAFMCGTVFLRLAHIICMSGKDMEMLGAQEYTEHLAAVERFQNCINIIRGSTDYMYLGGNDPPSRRPQYLYVRSRKWNAPLNSTMVAQMFSQFACVDIQMTDRTQGLVAINHYGAARSILKNFRNHNLIHVAWYSPFKHSPTLRKILWAGVVVSTGVCLWTLWSGLKAKQ